MTDDKFIGELKTREERVGLIVKQRAISILWTVDDVKRVRPDLTDLQCAEVLYDVGQGHNPAIGINLSVIQEFAHKLFPSKP